MMVVSMLPPALASKIKISLEGCWLWTGRPNAGGYGRAGLQGKLGYTHRLVYELLRGPVPLGFELDHLCRNRACCNPAHLEVVTHVENCRRGLVGKNMRSKTHCPQGHEYTPENTRFCGGSRHCRECNRGCQQKRRASLANAAPSE